LNNTITNKPLSPFLNTKIGPSKSLVAFWNPPLASLVYGETIDCLSDNNIILQHMIKTNPRNKSTEHLKKCQGCLINNIFVKHYLNHTPNIKNATCVMIQNSNNIVTLKEKKNEGKYLPKGIKSPLLLLDIIK